MIGFLVLAAFAEDDENTFTREEWYAVLPEVDIVCLKMDPDAGGKDSWSAPNDEPPLDTLDPEAGGEDGWSAPNDEPVLDTLDPGYSWPEWDESIEIGKPQIGETWREDSADHPGPPCWEEITWYEVVVVCTNECKCNSTCSNTDADFVCRIDDHPELLPAFDRGQGWPVYVSDPQCPSNPNPNDPDFPDDGPGYPA